ncbi:MAG: DNA polymerase IV [Chitinophagaceae bacterium]|nr:DNA polymerase IV [Chitinophagaceae bacterium]
MILQDQRHIAHMDLDSFYVSVERLRNRKLEGKPVLIGGTGDRAVVASCSYEARKFGVQSAMPMKIARRLCPHAIIVRGDMELYSKYSSQVTEVINDSVPLFEKSSIDEFYMDMTGMERFFGCVKYIHELKNKIGRECGLPISYAVSANKLISKVATNEVKPNGQIEIQFGQEKSFLAPLSVAKIPGIGKQTAFLLIKMGVETVKTLSEIPGEMLENLLGKNGAELWRRANGIDDSPVVPYHEQKSISTENTFSQDTIDLDFLHREIVRMTEKIGFELRSQNKLTGCITIKLRYSNFETFTKQETIVYTNADHILIDKAMHLFEKLYDRRMLIRLVGVRFSHLIPGNYQISLFEDTQETIHLYQSIDSIKRRFGENLIMKASGLHPSSKEGEGK